MPETLEKPAVKRRNWTQAQVAALVSAYASKIAVVHELVPFSEDERQAKLIELGLVQKPAKPTLHEGSRKDVAEFIAEVLPDAQPQRTLAIRYAIRSLQALLPKRAAK